MFRVHWYERNGNVGEINNTNSYNGIVVGFVFNTVLHETLAMVVSDGKVRQVPYQKLIFDGWRD